MPAVAQASVTIIDALRDPQLLGHGPFSGLRSWAPWLSFLRVLYGLPLEPGDLELYREATGRTDDPPSGGFDEALVIVGRQAGKSQIASALVTFDAAFAEGQGTGAVYSIIIAQDERAARRVIFGYINDLLDGSGVLSQAVLERNKSTLTLENKRRIAVYPCEPRAVRGIRASLVILDELAHFRGSDNVPRDRDMRRAVRPCLATTGGKLLAITTPYSRTGVVYDIFKQHHGQDGSPILVWKAPAVAMHPSLSPRYIESMRREDPMSARAEVDGEFLDGIETLIASDVLEACVVPGRRELPYLSGESRYSCFVDPSGGRHDAFTAAVAHVERGQGGAATDRLVLDALRAYKAPCNPQEAIADIAGFARSYKVGRVHGDRYAAGFVMEAFKLNGLRYEPSPMDRSQLYLDVLPRVNSGTVELLDDAVLLRELRGLERRRGPSGRDRVDHMRGAHDDVANAAAGALAMAAREGGSSRIVIW